jgi:hypothetical protein
MYQVSSVKCQFPSCFLLTIQGGDTILALCLNHREPASENAQACFRQFMGSREHCGIYGNPQSRKLGHMPYSLIKQRETTHLVSSCHDLFTDAHQVGVLDYLSTYQHVPLTAVDIDRFIERTITNPAHPRAWNAGYLAGWLAGMAAVEGTTDYAVTQVHHPGGESVRLHLVEGSAHHEDDSTLVPVIPMEDPLVHTITHPFCRDPLCRCHDDQARIALVHEQVQQGLFTPQEATDFVNGKIGRW